MVSPVSSVSCDVEIFSPPRAPRKPSLTGAEKQSFRTAYQDGMMADLQRPPAPQISLICDEKDCLPAADEPTNKQKFQ